MGGPIPKQYRILGNVPVIRHTLMAFIRHPEISEVQAVIHPADLKLYEEAAAGLELRPPVIGGNTRQESVRFGLESLADHPPRKVLIHDAVRPFVEQETISAVIAALEERPAVITGLSVPDTLKRCSAGVIEATVDRSGLWRAQTPQGFHFGELLKAHEKVHFENPNKTDLTDDSLVIEHYGLPVSIIDGGDDNFKITTERDLRRAELILERGRQETHVGWGFDFASLSLGDNVTLCGIPVAFHAGIDRASNADVPLNSVTDSLLGTVSESPSKLHFRPDSPSFRGKTSDFYVRQAVSAVAMKGGHIVHVDLTVLAATPTIEPHRAAMVIRLASLLSIDPSRISIKQVETYQTGFYGRGDKIGAQCIATVVYPAV